MAFVLFEIRITAHSSFKSDKTVLSKALRFFHLIWKMTWKISKADQPHQPRNYELKFYIIKHFSKKLSLLMDV